MLVSGVLVGPRVRGLGERGALLLGLTCGALGFGLQAFAPSALWFWAGIPLINLWSINGPAMQSLMVARVAATEQGQLQGALQSLRGLCSLVTPVLFTQVFVLGTPLLAGAPYWLAAALVAAALLLALRVTAPRTL